MNTIEIYLKESGSNAELKVDFRMFKDAYQNKLIDIYVPKSIIYSNNQNTFNVTVKTGALMTAPNGSKISTKSYYASYLKDVIIDNIEYSVYEQKMPKEYSVYAGQTKIICNIVNIDNTDLDNPKVLNIITTQECYLTIYNSDYLEQEEIVEPSQFEQLTARVTTVETNIVKNTNDIDELTERVENIENVQYEIIDIGNLQTMIRNLPLPQLTRVKAEEIVEKIKNKPIKVLWHQISRDFQNDVYFDVAIESNEDYSTLFFNYRNEGLFMFRAFKDESSTIIEPTLLYMFKEFEDKIDANTQSINSLNRRVNTNTSDITIIKANYITKSVNDLLNYYLKNETYNKSEVNDLISSISASSFLVVDRLPTNPLSNVIYLVPAESPEQDNYYNEYVYINGQWEMIGSTKVDLSNYYNKTQIDEKFNNVNANITTLSDGLQETDNRVTENSNDIDALTEKVAEIELFKFPNAVIMGDPTINNGQVSGFSVDNYLVFPFILDVGDRNFQIDFAFTTGSDVTTQQNVLDSKFGIALAIANGKGLMAVSGNGTNWTGTSVGTINISPNTTYYARLTWNKLVYKTALSTDGVSYTDDMTITMAQRPYPRTIYIGGGNAEELGRTPNVFKGIINMNKASLSVGGAIIWQGMDDVGLATRADVSLSNLDELGEQRFNQKANITDLTSGTLIVNKATNDGNGNNIVNTYVTKNDLSGINNQLEDLNGVPASTNLLNYPIGAIYLSMNNTSPASLFGGSWEQLAENYTLWTATSGAGETINAGLPNITGLINGVEGFPRVLENYSLTGAFKDSYVKPSGVTGFSASNAYKLEYIDFKASNSNLIYGNSTTVQPPAIKVYAWKRIS